MTKKMSRKFISIPVVFQISWKNLQLSRAKLKVINRTSAIMAGFSMVAIVELQISEDTNAPAELIIVFVICSSLLVSVHMLALLISMFLLPNLDAVANMHNINSVEESYHDVMHWYIEIGWAFSTGIGLFLFICEVVIISWVKFYDYSKIAASSAITVMLPVFFLFVMFGIHFYRKLIAHQFEVSETKIKECDELASLLPRRRKRRHKFYTGNQMTV